jgi:hypothetical protein
VRELGIAAPPPTAEGKKASKKDVKAAEEYERALAEAPNHPISGLLAEQGARQGLLDSFLSLCLSLTHSHTLASVCS